jgi:hypothetical protein
MALNFPNSPTLNQVYTDSTSGFSYQWNGTVWISFSASSSSQIKTLDDISASFNSSTTIFPLTSSGNAITPPTPQSLIINLGGVVQDPTDDYSVSGSNIVFTTAPTSGLSFSGVSLGPAVPIGVSTIGDVYNRQVYSVTGVQTSFAFPSGYTVGYLDVFRNGVRLIAGDDFTATTGNSFSLSPPAQNTDDVEAIGYKVSTIAVTEGNLINLIVNQNATVLGITSLGAGVGAGQTALFVQGNVRIAGITTITNASGTVTIGIGTTALLVEGNARVTGILTVGSASITLNGITDTINVGTGLTLSSSGIVAGGLNVGVATASSVIVGSAVTINSSGINVTGITTIKNASGTVTIGIGTTALLVEGNARVTGILTVGTGSITLDGTNNSINLGQGLTLSPSGITGTASSVTSASVSYGLTGTPSITVGIATVNTTLSLVGNYIEDVNAVGALNIDCSAGNYFTKTIEGDSTFTVSNVPVTGAYAFTLELTHTSGTVTWFSGVEWPASTAPTLTTGKTHLFMFVTDNGGTRWRGSSLVDYTN